MEQSNGSHLRVWLEQHPKSVRMCINTSLINRPLSHLMSPIELFKNFYFLKE